MSATRRASAASLALQHPCLCPAVETTGSAVPTEAAAISDLAAAVAHETVVVQTVSSTAPERMKSPITSYPCSRSRYADTELSTPPLIARTTRRGMGIGTVGL